MKKRVLNRVLVSYRDYKRKLHNSSQENLQKSIKSLLSKCKYLFLTTHYDSEYCSSRYVQPIVEWEEHSFKIWIGTHAESRKIREIKGNPLVTLAGGQDKDGANIIIYGKATLHTDDIKRKRYWKPEWKLFFPDGPTSDDAILICVVPQRIELMDFKRNIFPEPFGLYPQALLQKDNRWVASK